MKMLIAAALLAAPGQGEARVDQFCADLKRLATGAGETPAFGSLAGTSLHSLLGSRCVLGTPAPVAFLCTRSLLPPEISGDSMIARMKQCLRDVRVTRDPSGYRTRLIEHKRLRIRMSEHGDDRAHVGRIVTLYFEAVR